jgi:hypothetical protein
MEPYQIKMMDSIGFDWTPHDNRWEKGFSLFEKFVQENGHAMVPVNLIKDGFHLGNWVRVQSTNYKNGKISPEKISRLEKLGFIWNRKETHWEEIFSLFKKFVKEKGHTHVPRLSIKEDIINLGNWVTHQRQNKNKLTTEQISRMDALGFDWEPLVSQWENGFLHLEEYIRKEGHTKVPRGFKTEDGFTLGIWVAWQRSRKDNLTHERKSRLDSLGFVWKVK